MGFLGERAIQVTYGKWVYGHGLLFVSNGQIIRTIRRGAHKANSGHRYGSRQNLYRHYYYAG